MLTQVIKWIIALLSGSFLVSVFLLKLGKTYIKNSTKIKSPTGMSKLEEITLGGLKQWIFVRGKDKDNPILLFLHGGPGAPLAGIPSSRRLDKKLIENYTVVHWDQRGAGKSYNKNITETSLTLNNLVEDCNELIDYLRDRFSKDKIFLAGHSHGSVIGIRTAHEYPEKIHAYVGVAQIINDARQQKLGYEFAKEKATQSKDKKVLNSLEELGKPPYDVSADYLKMAGYVFKYSGVVYNNAFRIMGRLMLDFLISPEYSFFESLKTMLNKGFIYSTETMWDELLNIEIDKEIKKLEVPVYFIEGKHDMATPTSLAIKYLENLKAPVKELIIFENSAHVPMAEENERYQDILINKVLKETLP